MENRNKIISEYVTKIIYSMDTNTVCEVLADYIRNSKDEYTDEQLITEILEYYPELLESNNE